jgi:hypothetical protein
MLQRIETPDGEAWAVVFNKCQSLEMISNYQRGLIGVLINATLPEIDCPNEFLNETLNLLDDLMLDSGQMLEYELSLINKR